MVCRAVFSFKQQFFTKIGEYSSEYNSETRGKAFTAIAAELKLLAEKGIIPQIDFYPNSVDYEVALFSAIDILEPSKNVTVWQLNSNGAITRNGLVDCIMDAQTQKIFSISIRSDRNWTQYDEGKIIQLWAEYLGTSTPESYEFTNQSVENATYYKQYALNGIDGEKTVITVGYYEGIREFFIKITKIVV